MAGSSSAAQKPRPLQEMDMKLTMPFLRRKPRRKPIQMDITSTWTSRDWADLPPYHPKRD